MYYKTLETIFSYNVFLIIGFVPPAIFCVVMGFLTCEQRTLGVVILCLTVAFTGCSRAGVYCNLAEIAPE